MQARRERAGEGSRTLDLQLGKLSLYQLSYARVARSIAIARSPRNAPDDRG